jgi:aldose 1-epimerase
VIEQRIDLLELQLSVAGSPDFNYRADLVYALISTGLSVELTAINMGADAMPFGIGLHPWFASNDQTRVEFHANRQVLTDTAGLPVRVSGVIQDFSTPHVLPAGRVDSTYLDWEGTALLHHEGSTVQLQSTAPILHVFSPASSAGFCCLEPQTAVPNAANFGADGGNLLSPGERMSVSMSISCA